MLITRDDLAKIDFSDVVEEADLLPFITPGQVLWQEFMEPLGLTAKALAERMGVPTNRITEILRGERKITANTAILLSNRLGPSARFWMNLQVEHDLEVEAVRLARPPAAA